MDRFREVRPAALLFFFTAASLGSAFLTLQNTPYLSFYWYTPAEIAARSSPLVFLCACVLLFVRPRLGFIVGVIAGLIALPWFVETEFSVAPFNSWIYLNYDSPILSGSEAYLTFTKLKILSVTLTAIAVAYALFHLLRVRWSLRGAFAAGILVLTLWFGSSVTPYQIPALIKSGGPDLRILHIEKRGLRFHETLVAESRDTKAFISRNDRRLFQYRSQGRAGIAVLGEASPAVLQRARAFVHLPELWKLHTPVPGPLRAWNAEGWYVVLQDARLLAFTSENGTAPPAEVIEMFRLIENLPSREEHPFAIRDVCLGFCYDPVAALGFAVLPQRIALLSQNASVQ